MGQGRWTKVYPLSKMTYKFSFAKYRQWRIDHDKLNDEIINILEGFNSYEELDGQDFDELWRKGKIILKEWCDYE